MKKDVLIAKQQIEIEDLKERLKEVTESVRLANNELIFIEQWSTKCPDFPKIAMNRVVAAENILREI